MKSVQFEGWSVEIAKNQPQYNSIFAMPVRGQEGKMVMCYEMNDEEVKEFAETKRVYLTQLTFGNHFQPMRMFTETEFKALLPAWKSANADPEPSPMAVQMAMSAWMHASTGHIPVDTNLAAQFIKIIDGLLRSGYVNPNQEQEPSGDTNN